ncbi:MAG: ABC transporter substrate-binding protein, partial [Firmicutes bacterium]|nr:ABC transporter substrate-binding protein [Bacillota bacterium]
MKRRVEVCSLLLVLALVFFLGVSATAGELTKVRLSEVVRSVFYAPMYAAISQGLFAEEGIEIDLSTAWGADKGAAALISGSVDIG